MNDIELFNLAKNSIGELFDSIDKHFSHSQSTLSPFYKKGVVTETTFEFTVADVTYFIVARATYPSIGLLVQTYVTIDDYVQIKKYRDPLNELTYHSGREQLLSLEIAHAGTTKPVEIPFKDFGFSYLAQFKKYLHG